LVLCYSHVKLKKLTVMLTVDNTWNRQTRQVKMGLHVPRLGEKHLQCF